MSQVDRPSDPDPDVVEALHLDASANPGRRRRRILLGGGAVGIVVAALSFALTPRISTTFETIVASRATLTVEVTAIGTVQPRNAVDVSSELSGVVAAVHVEANDSVVKDQPLATLSTDLLAAQLDQVVAQAAASRAGLAQARLIAEQAQSDLARAEGLAGSAISAAELDRTRAAWLQAAAAIGVSEGNLAASRAAAAVARTTLHKAVIRSPIDGVVLDRNIESGQAVVSSLQTTTLFRVAEDLAEMEVEVAIDEADIGRVREGQHANFTVAAYDNRLFEAEVASVKLYPTASQGVVTYEATLEVDNLDRALVPGMTATAAVLAEVYDDVLVVPNAALRFAPEGEEDLETLPPGQGRLWLVDGEQASPVVVSLGASDGRFTQVIDGLGEGAQLAVGQIRKRGRAP
jgi:HlyD family secretion protein